MTDDATHPGPQAGRCYAIRAWLARVLLRPTRLWRQMVGFGLVLEDQVIPAASEAGRGSVEVVVGSDGLLHYGVGKRRVDLEGFSVLAAMLRSVGVERLVLNARLESNQVVDVLVLLHGLRRRLRKPCQQDPTVCLLCGEAGVAIACTRTRLSDGVLTIDYSYCMTCFSRFVRWFESGKKHFGDHRAMFASAPRYAALAGALAILPTIVCAMWGSWPMMLVMGFVSGGLLFALVYLFFMTVGSVEYDREEKAHNLDRALADLQAKSRRVQQDVQRAKIVQAKLIPTAADLPCGQAVRWASRFVPADEVGGDYFDATVLGPHTVGMLFCDVSGHGMAAAFITALMKTAFQDWSDHGAPLEQFVSKLNGQLCRFTPDESFAAAVAAVYHCDSGLLEYVNCGHSPSPYRIPAANGSAEALTDGRTLLLGVEEEITILAGHATFAPGDRLVLVTDGLVEGMDPEGAMYGFDRLAAQLANGHGGDLDAMLEALMTDVSAWTRGGPQADDQTVLAFEVLKNPDPDVTV